MSVPVATIARETAWPLTNLKIQLRLVFFRNGIRGGGPWFFGIKKRNHHPLQTDEHEHHTFYKLKSLLTELFPTVNWRPFPMVFLPYLGVLAGSHDNGSPTTTYKPVATTLDSGIRYASQFPYDQIVPTETCKVFDPRFMTGQEDDIADTSDGAEYDLEGGG